MIFAQPNTITGSIGVLAGKFANVGILEKLFIHQEEIYRGKNIHIYEPAAPFSESERAVIEGYIHRIYDMFVERVSRSRDIESGDVDAIGGGRVWTGRQALERGLIDTLGGVDQAFDKIRELTNLGPRAPVRFFTPGKQYFPPISEPVSMLKYGIEGIGLLEGRAVCLCPWDEVQRTGR
jgi:protease-4